MLALAAFLSLYLAAAMALVARWRPRDAGACRAPLRAPRGCSPSSRVASCCTGFPWVASGYAHVDAPLAGLASWLGVYGVGAVAAGARRLLRLLAPDAGARPGFARAERSSSRWSPARSSAGSTSPAPTRALTVSLLQGNVPQEEKFDGGRLDSRGLAATAAQIEAARGELVVGPETVIPVLFTELDEKLLASACSRASGAPGRAAILGIPMGDAEHGYTNSALGLSAGASAQPSGFYRYDKHHLVPFGEFVPDGFHWFTRMMNIPLGDFERGPLTAPSFEVDGERVAPNICYEDLFGEELAARFVPEASAPTILANLSNIGWFGRTIAVEQHLRISRMRSLELQRPMIRATNTGATVVIDHRGTVTHALAPFTRRHSRRQRRGSAG